MASSNLSKSAIPAFYLFRDPLIIAPSYEIMRTAITWINKVLYIRSFEDNFTQAGLERGFKKGIFACADAIRNDKQERLKYLLISSALKHVRNRVVNIPPELLNDRLSFTEDNIVATFVHSYLVSTDKLLGVSEKYKPSVYATVVAFIDKNSTEPISVRAARKRTDELLICNITFARIFIPLGRWQISDVNFFDGNAIKYL